MFHYLGSEQKDADAVNFETVHGHLAGDLLP